VERKETPPILDKTLPDNNIRQDEISSSVTLTATKTPKLRVPAHGNGRLLTGGLPGNPGGRKPSKVRALMRRGLRSNLPVLHQIANGTIEASPGDRVRAIEVLARYGLGPPPQLTKDVGGPKEIVLRVVHGD
jgi:hypothetical protein